MSLADYEDFYYGACLVGDDGDPLTAWQRASEETKRLAEWIEGHEEVRVSAPGTDIKLGIAGRKFIPCDGDHNMPDGEFFTGPVEDSVEGEVSFHLPAVIGGREVSGVRLGSRRARSSTPAPSGARSSWSSCSTPTPGARTPRRAGDRHQLRDRPRHPRGPARREDRRHRPHGGRPQPTRSPVVRTSPRSTPIWSATSASAASSKSMAR